MLVATILTLQTFSPCDAFEFLGNKKWEPGIGTVSVHGGKLSPPMSPGGASWSAIPSGVGLSDDAPVGFFPLGATTTDIEFLITPEVDGLEYSIFNDAINVWAAVANFTNLGKVDDGASLFPGLALIADTDANYGNIGDMRIAAIPFFSGALARGFSPCLNNFGDCDEGGSIGGDILFNINQPWIDDPNDVSGNGEFDFFTVALHEIGHALGLNHSSVNGAVMEFSYEGSRRSLAADDIAGITALYGERIPEPGSIGLALLGATGIFYGRRRRRF